MQLISDDYRALNVALHESRADYGTSGQKFAPAVARLLRLYNFHTVLDYGCGKGTLRASLPRYAARIREYDPAVPGKDAPPEPADLVVCTDVLEHIEPEQLDAVLADIARLTRVACYLVIDTGPAHKQLADGRNAHLIQEPVDWWLARLQPHVRVESWAHVSAKEVSVLAVPLGSSMPRTLPLAAARERVVDFARTRLPAPAKRVLRGVARRVGFAS